MDIQKWVNEVDPEYLIEIVSQKRRIMTTKRYLFTDRNMLQPQTKVFDLMWSVIWFIRATY